MPGYTSFGQVGEENWMNIPAGQEVEYGDARGGLHIVIGPARINMNEAFIVRRRGKVQYRWTPAPAKPAKPAPTGRVLEL